MENNQSLEQIQKQSLRLSRQQLQFVRLLELTAPELEEKVSEELESNPALEALPDSVATDRSKDSQNWRGADGRSAGSASGVSPADYSTGPRPNVAEFSPEDLPSLYEHLNASLDELNLDPEVRLVARYIIGNLDNNGYLRSSLSQILLDIALAEGTEPPMKTAEEALDIVRSLDPPGIGGSSLQETLILQLRRLPPSPERENALRILTDQFEPFSKKSYRKIASSLRLSEPEVEEAVGLILQLNPKPGAQFEGRAAEANNYVLPDFILEETDDGLSISLANRIPELTVQQSFATAVDTLRETRSPKARKGAEYIFNRVNDARDFIRLLGQRQESMMKVAAAILSIQRDYFKTRDVYALRPMMIKDITRLTGLDQSVVSRATAGKYIQTPWGIFPMRFFFSESVGANPEDTGADALTNRKIEAEIRRIVENEDKQHPLSDERLQQEMTAIGYRIARRTITKYRERLQIPVARLRKK